jgi:hypothetical protein
VKETESPTRDGLQLTDEQLEHVSGGYDIVQAESGKWMVVGKSDPVFDSFQEVHDFLMRTVWAERG